MPRDKNIFTLNPTSLDMSRSVFPRNSQLKTSFNLGSIVPIYLDEVIPGDTVSLDLANVIRTSTPPIYPIMDNMYADVYFFFVPNRLVWSHWEQFCGANDTTAWTQTNDYSIPMVDLAQESTELTTGSLGDYFGVPIIASLGYKSAGTRSKVEISELPLRGYWKIVNDWFIDENSIGPKLYTIGDTANTNIHYSDVPAVASRFHDLFSSCLPAPQKGASVELPLGDVAPIKFVGDATKWDYIKNRDGTAVTGGTPGLMGVPDDGKSYLGDENDAAYALDNSAHLAADLSKATAATVNQVRLAFQLQKLLEKDARGGTRYQELLLSHFGVRGSDARLQRAEYIAGHRFRINIDQVLATANTNDGSDDAIGVVGQTGAVSKTAGASSMFTKSFTEHGMLIGVVVIRQDHTYSEGIDRFLTKKKRFDFYYPVLANIGEQPVYKSEICVRGLTGNDYELGEKSGVFGYQEAWYEYRFKPSRCTGFMNPSTTKGLSSWTLGDVYSSVPSLGQSFLEEDKNFLDRALVVDSDISHQFIADFYFKTKWSRVMPLYSIPGLIDHH